MQAQSLCVDDQCQIWACIWWHALNLYAQHTLTNFPSFSVVPNFGGRRCAVEGPASVQEWGVWDCDPAQEGRKATSKHSFGSNFPWSFDVMEKAYILEGSATMTPDDPSMGLAVTIKAKDMVTFPKGWTGKWEVHSFLKKRYAFFDGKGIQIDEDIDEDEEEEEEEEEEEAVPAKTAKAKLPKDKLKVEMEEQSNVTAPKRSRPEEAPEDDTAQKMPKTSPGASPDNAGLDQLPSVDT